MRAALVFCVFLSAGCGLHFGVDAALGSTRQGAHRGEPEPDPEGAVLAYRALVQRLCADGTLTPEQCDVYVRLLPILEAASGVPGTKIPRR